MLTSLYWAVHRFRRKTLKHWQVLDEFQRLDPEAARNVLHKRLRDTLCFFAERADALPEWKEVAGITDPNEFWDAWSKLPIITKKDLQTRFHPTKLTNELGVRGILLSTGGSTGEPTPFIHTPEVFEANYATSLYARRSFGWRPGLPTIVVWGSERDIGKQRTLLNRSTAYLRKELLVDGYSLSERTTKAVHALIHRHQRVAFWGFSSLLEFIARQTLEGGLKVPKGSVVAAWNGGEMLSEAQSDLFLSAFGTPIRNMYGGRELSAMAYQKLGSSALSVMRPYLFLEIVDENGNPAAPGEIGRLIWTSTVGRGTPFVRYDIGDVGSADEQGRDISGIHSLTTLQGRTGGLIKLGDGKTIGGLFWNHFFKDFPEVRQFQVAVLSENLIELRLVGTPFSPDRETELRRILHDFLGEVVVQVKWVEKLKLTAQGKLVQVVREAT